MGLSNKLPCEAGSFFCRLNRHRYLQPDVLRVYFPAQESWVAQSVSLPSCSPGLSTHKCGTARSSSRRLPTHPLHPSCASPPLLPVWMNVSSLSPWLSDFHTVRFSVSSGCFLFLNCCCPSFGCARRHGVSTYAFFLAGSKLVV